MVYALIELLSLNFALNPLFCKTLVTCWPSFLYACLLILFFFKRWQYFKTIFLGLEKQALLQFLALCGWLVRIANVLALALAYYSSKFICERI